VKAKSAMAKPYIEAKMTTWWAAQESNL